MDKNDRDALFYNLKNIGQTVKNISTGIQYDAVEINKKLDEVNNKLDIVIQNTNLLDVSAVYTAERLYLEHEKGASYRDLANRSGLSLSQVRTRINNHKKKLLEEGM